MKFDALNPLEVKRRFAKVLGVSASRLYLTSKDLAELAPMENPARLAKVLEEVATLPAKDLAELQALLDPCDFKAGRGFLLLKDWAKPFLATALAKRTAKEKAQDNLQASLRGLGVALDALKDATKRAKEALQDGNTCDAFKEALEGAQAALEEVQQRRATLETF